VTLIFGLIEGLAVAAVALAVVGAIAAWAEGRRKPEPNAADGRVVPFDRGRRRQGL
jgi:hypothetical protein